MIFTGSFETLSSSFLIVSHHFLFSLVSRKRNAVKRRKHVAVQSFVWDDDCSIKTVKYEEVQVS